MPLVTIPDLDAQTTMTGTDLVIIWDPEEAVLDKTKKITADNVLSYMRANMGLIEASTAGSGAPNVLTASESGKIISNEGAAAVAYNTLPTAAAGLWFGFICQDPDGIRITADTGDTIAINDKKTATAGYIQSIEVGSVVFVYAINATEWVAIASGSWILDGTSLWNSVFPAGEISYFDTTGTGITIGAQSDGSTNMVVVNPTTALTAISSALFDNGGGNTGRLRYIDLQTKTFNVTATVSGTPSTSDDVFVFGIAKNGAVVVDSKILASSGGTQSNTIQSLVSIANNEYVEVYVGNITAARNFTVKSLNLRAVGV